MTARTLEGRAVSAILYGSVIAMLAFFYLPILTLIAFSFREGRHLALPFDGLTWHWYLELIADRDFLDAATNSLIVAALVTVISTALGTALILALVRFRFPFRRIFAVFNLAPLLFPQLLLGIVLLLWFSLLGNWIGISLGLATVTIGHVVYITPFAAIVVGVRLASLDPDFEHAAYDCGAGIWTTYRHITLPLLWPGIFSAAIFAFLLSWSNFYISFNLNGTTALLPTFVYAGLAVNSSPLYPAIATVSFIPSILLVILAERFRRKGMTAARRPFAASAPIPATAQQGG